MLPPPPWYDRIRDFLNRHLARYTAQTAEDQFRRQYRRRLAELRQNPGGRRILARFRYEPGPHPHTAVDEQCAFAAEFLAERRPVRVLDIGSFRQFTLGLLARYPVTTVDVRARSPATPNETILLSEAKTLDLPDESFDAVVSLAALEHFGLGRYGDEFDLTADQKAIAEMIRVLQPGGYLIFTTTLTRATPAIFFNSARIYDHAWIQERCSGLVRIAERYYSRRLGKYIPLHEVTAEPDEWDLYFGCWSKPKRVVYTA